MAATKEDLDLDRRTLDKNRSRVDTTVTVTHILTTIGMVYAVFAWGGEVKIAQAVQGSTLQTMKADHDRYRAETLQTLRDINKKLDDIALRGNNNGTK